MSKQVKVFNFFNENNHQGSKYEVSKINEDLYNKLNEFLRTHNVFQIEKIGNDILVFFEEE